MHEILIGLVITFIVAVVIELLFHGMDRDSPMRTAAAGLYGRTSRYEHPFDSYNRRGPERVKSLFVRWLSGDQVRHGGRRGQFGASIDPGEEERFKGTLEALGTKPRLYLTSWPCFILKRQGLAPRQLRMAEDAIEQLLQRDPTGRSGVRYVRVAQSVLTDGPVGSQPLLVSYRHTIRAAHILFSLNSKSTDAWAVVSTMLDGTSDWQCPSGGWRECDRRLRDEDLVGSGYAVALLFDVIRHSDHCLTINADEAAKALKSSIGYLRQEWSRTLWAYGGVPSAENALLVFHEVALALKQFDPDFFAQCSAWLKSWILPTGFLSEGYLQRCPNTSAGAAYARFAYGVFLSNENDGIWKGLYEKSLQHFPVGLNAADVAFLLDLTCALSGPGFGSQHGLINHIPFPVKPTGPLETSS